MSSWSKAQAQYCSAQIEKGARGSAVIEALCYKPDGRGFETKRGEYFFNLPRPWGSLSL
jgi:hypothetical protein